MNLREELRADNYLVVNLIPTDSHVKFNLFKMNVVLQRHGARYIYPIPEGLKELMSDISREVLRSQPEQMYAFIADYCDCLFITRENARIACSLVASLTDCSLTIVELLERTGMERSDAEEKASIIQRAFR